MRPTGAVLAMLGLLALGAPGLARAHGGDPDLVHACASVPRGGQGGVLRVVGPDESCRPGEAAVDWPGSIGDQPPPPASPRFVVRDANGTEVGRFAGMNSVSTPFVHVTANGRRFTLEAQKTRLVGTNLGIVFDGDNCTGNPFLPSNFLVVDRALTTLAVAVTRQVSPGPQVYATGEGGGTPQAVDVKSTLPSDTGDCDDTDLGGTSAVPLDVFTLTFEGPFTGQYE